MESFLQIGLSNAVAAAILAILAAIATRIWKNPHFANAVWLLVMLRFIAPPIWTMSIPVPEAQTTANLAELSALPVPIVEPSKPGSGGTGNSSPVFAAPAISEIAEEGRSRSSERRETAGTPVAWTLQPATPSDEGKLAACPTVQWSAPQVWSSEIGPAEWIAFGWFWGALFAAGWGVVQLRRFGRMVRVTEAADSALRESAERIARKIGLRRLPQIRVVEGPIPPMVWAGSLRPVILLPRELWRRLGSCERDLLLAHELMHVRRGDHCVRWFETLVRAVYWWHPVAWWAAKRLRQAEEECCDAAVLRNFPGDGERYGETLLAACEFISLGTIGLPACASSFGGKQHLKRRLLMILNDSGPKKLSLFQRAIVATVGAAAILLSWNLASAQKPPVPADSATSPAPVITSPQAAPTAAAQRKYRRLPGRKQYQGLSRQTPVPGGGPVAIPDSGEVKEPDSPQKRYERKETRIDADSRSTPEGRQLSEKVRNQVIEKLLQGVKDGDTEVARRSLMGLNRLADEKIATQALMSLLERPVSSQEGALEMIDFAGQLVGSGIREQRLIEYLIKIAQTSPYAIVRQHGINTLVELGVANTDPKMVQLFVATIENPAKAPGATKGDVQPVPSPGTSEPVLPRLAGINDLINRARPATRTRRVMREEVVMERTGDGRDKPRLIQSEELVREPVGQRNDRVRAFQRPEGVRVGERIGEERSEQQSNEPPLQAAAVRALESIVPQSDAVALALIEAINHKDPRIRRAAASALANAAVGTVPIQQAPISQPLPPGVIPATKPPEAPVDSTTNS